MLLQEAEARARSSLARAPADYLPTLQLAEIYAVRGQHAEAVRALEQAVERGWRDLPQLRAHPAFDSLREERRFRHVVERMTGMNAAMLRKARA